jgi:hypothetical protein
MNKQTARPAVNKGVKFASDPRVIVKSTAQVAPKPQVGGLKTSADPRLVINAAQIIKQKYKK